MQSAKQLHSNAMMVDPVYWSTTNKLELQGGPFKLKGHEYQHMIFTETARRQCTKKGAQLGFSEAGVIKTLHGMIYNKYPVGVLYLFPTGNDVTDFSKGRFQPLIDDNRFIKEHVINTDAANIKRIRKAMLYLRGARASKKIQGTKKSSVKLKGIPVDRIVFDECDEMEEVMITLALQRLAHSNVGEEYYLSTPSIPNYGIDKMYDESDQRLWMIRCEHCSTETCLEMEFPKCIDREESGRWFRACKKCGKEIFPKDGRWEAQYPLRSKDLVGWWVSQLNSLYVDPGVILNEYNNPPDGDPSEVYNSRLGMAYIPSENRLTTADIFMCCGQDKMAYEHYGPCAMGVDVGKVLHVVVGCRTSTDRLKVVYITRVDKFEDLHEVAKRFNVKSAVFDILPETRKCREFQEAAPFQVSLCQYMENPTQESWTHDGLVKTYRTEICDKSHQQILLPGHLELPARNEEVNQFAREASNLVKLLDTNEETGKKTYRYKNTGADHYRHALNYFLLAATRIGIAERSIINKLKKTVVRDGFMTI